MSYERTGEPGAEAPFRYHVELSPAQLKITHTALRSLLDDFGHDEPDIVELIRAVLAKLPDEHAVRAIDLDRELGPAAGLEQGGSGPRSDSGRGEGDEPPAAA